MNKVVKWNVFYPFLNKEFKAFVKKIICKGFRSNKILLKVSDLFSQTFDSVPHEYEYYFWFFAVK